MVEATCCERAEQRHTATTLGGIHIDKHGRVLNADNSHTVGRRAANQKRERNDNGEMGILATI